MTFENPYRPALKAETDAMLARLKVYSLTKSQQDADDALRPTTPEIIVRISKRAAQIADMRSQIKKDLRYCMAALVGADKKQAAEFLPVAYRLMEAL